MERKKKRDPNRPSPKRPIPNPYRDWPIVDGERQVGYSWQMRAEMKKSEQTIEHRTGIAPGLVMPPVAQVRHRACNRTAADILVDLLDGMLSLRVSYKGDRPWSMDLPATFDCPECWRPITVTLVAAKGAAQREKPLYVP